MALTLCTQCSASVPGEARFCPRCGHEIVPGAAGAAHDSAGGRAAGGNRAPGALPSSSPMPLAGILFLAAAVLGPSLVAVGVSTGSLLLLLAGIGIAVALIAVLLMGMLL